MYPVKDADNGKIKYSGRSKAKVIDNRDPEKRGRIRVDHPTVGETGWIPLLKKPHEFDIPKIGDVVYVESDSGLPSHLVAHGSFIDGVASSPNIPSEFQRDVPTNRGLKTPLGHKIEFDDGEHETPQQAPEDTNLTTKNRGIRITTSAGNKIHLIDDSENGDESILIEDVNGNFLKIDRSDDSINVNAVGNINITCVDATITSSGTATVEGSEVKLGDGATEAVVKGDVFKTYIDGHTHPTAIGPSGPPVSPMPASNLSTKVKTE